MATKKPKTLEGDPKVLQATLDRVVTELAKSDDDRADLQERCRRYEEELIATQKELAATKEAFSAESKFHRATVEQSVDELKQRIADLQAELQKSQIVTTIQQADAGAIELRAVTDEPLRRRIETLENFIRKSVREGLNFTEAGEVLKGSA